MVVEIEDYRGDTVLYGPEISFREFKKQIKIIEDLYDKKEENFVALLCRIYNWTVFEDELEPQYIYDRDIKKFKGKSNRS